MESLFVELTQESATRYLSWWSWATGEDVSPISLTTFGDWVYERSDGSAHHLSVLDGAVERICASREDLSAALADPEAADRFLSATFARRAQRAGMRLAPGECYSFIVPPVIGGSFEHENVRAAAIGGYQLVMTQLAQLARYLPEGTDTKRLRMTFRTDGSLDLLVDGVSIRG